VQPTGGCPPRNMATHPVTLGYDGTPCSPPPSKSQTGSHNFRTLLQYVLEEHEHELTMVRAEFGVRYAQQPAKCDSCTTLPIASRSCVIDSEAPPDDVEEVANQHRPVVMNLGMTLSGMQPAPDPLSNSQGDHREGNPSEPVFKNVVSSRISGNLALESMEQGQTSDDEDSSVGGRLKLKSSSTMDLVFPGGYLVRPLFEKRKGKRKTSLAGSEGKLEIRSLTARGTAEFLDPPSCWKRLIMRPNSRRRLAWDFFGLVALVHDMFMVPLQTFDLPPTAVSLWVDWAIRIFWSLDMPAAVLVGYFDKGELVMNPWRIATHYLKTFFILDLVVVSGDWCLYLLEAKGGNGGDDARGLVRLLRVARLARIIRLLRFLKLRRFLQNIEDMINTETVTSYFKIIKPAIVILFVNHVAACVWWQIGTLKRNGKYWAYIHGIDEDSILYQYLTSLHWSLSQFTVGNMDVNPTNELERGFTVLVMCMGLTMFSSMVGSTTSAIESLRELKTDENRQFFLLHRFLKDYRVSKNLSHRILRFAEYAYQHRKSHLQEHSVGLLAVLSEQLHNELKFEVHMPHLSAHILFKSMMALPANALEKACRNSLFTKELARHDILFHAGEHCHQMVFVTEGELMYLPHECLKDGDSQTSFSVTHGDWAAEATLWSHWLHLGMLQAETESRLVAIDSELFGEAMQHTGHDTWLLTHAYAVTFVQQLNALPVHQFTDLLQLVISPEETLQLAVELNSQLERQVSSPRISTAPAL